MRTNYPDLSFAQLARLVYVPVQTVHSFLRRFKKRGPDAIYRRPCNLANLGRPLAGSFSNDKYLVRPSTLKSWAPLSLRERTAKIAKLFKIKRTPS